MFDHLKKEIEVAWKEAERQNGYINYLSNELAKVYLNELITKFGIFEEVWTYDLREGHLYLDNEPLQCKVKEWRDANGFSNFYELNDNVLMKDDKYGSTLLRSRHDGLVIVGNLYEVVKQYNIRVDVCQLKKVIDTYNDLIIRLQR